jgi:RNA polymerase sigma-70 factor, ECF subfamily
MTSDLVPISGSINPPLRPVASVSASNVPSAHSESDLIARILNGEASLFHALVTPCERPMFFKALSLLDNEADAEDVVQEAALKAFRSLAGFRNESSFKTWIIKITLNEARAMLRKRRRLKCESLDTCIDPESKENASRDVPDVQERPLETLLRREVGEILHKALRALPAKYQTVVELRYIEGFDTEKTAEMLGVSNANVKTRLSRARLRLRNAIVAPL